MGGIVQMHFTTPDYVIFALLLVASAGIGLFHAFSGGRQRTTQVGSSTPGSTHIYLPFSSEIEELGQTSM